MDQHANAIDRRRFITTGAATAATAAVVAANTNSSSAWGANSPHDDKPTPIVVPPEGKQILLSCKLGMIAKEDAGKKLTLVERLKLAGAAGFDGVDFDEAGLYTVEQARAAVWESGVFAHNAINHAHWQKRLTSPDEADRAQGVANIEHCLRVSHAIGGSAVLIVVGRGDDGTAEQVDQRAQKEIKKLIPLAASLGQVILFENVWNKMHYDHDSPPEQTPDRFIQFVDSFNSPWVGMYYDIGNHWKYGQPRQWLQAFNRRAVKLDVKGFSRAKNKFVDITSDDDDLPWGEVQKGLKEIGFTGWTTAEVGGGGLERL
ncbi:MAG: sugar phosphate isomerase/epimerase family protein, partial [Pirellula sp.]